MRKVCCLLILLLPILALAQLEVSPLFSDNMVLQRAKPIRVSGRGTPGDEVHVVFLRQKKKAIVKKDSTWMVTLKKQGANASPRSLLITSGKQKVELKNILIGDVWIASGQSNMEWPMSREQHWKEEAKNALQPLIRLCNPTPAGRYVYGVAYNDSLRRRLNKDSFYLWKGWKNCDSQSVRDMSAVAYFFAKTLVEQEQVPIGLANLAIGGAPIETFISRGALGRNKRFASKIEGNWLENNELPQWIRQRGKENVGNQMGTDGNNSGPAHAYKPGFAYECGIEPLADLPVKGVIWYQGESNALEKERVEEYMDLISLMIGDYRRIWKQPELPFYWVQLSSIDTAYYSSKFWPLFRDEQRRLLHTIDHGGMAVTSDIGSKNNVHPTNKKAVGERLARWALNKTYGKKILPSGPLPLKAVYREGSIIVSFRYGAGLGTNDHQPLRGFSLDGSTEIEAMIKNNTVIIAVGEKPQLLYYGWKPYTEANLVNADRLPASTFKIRVD